MTKNIEDIIENAPVVNDDGTPYVPKWYNKLDDWMFDNVWGYAFLWRLWRNQLHPMVNYFRVKRFFQRLIRGFDDSETWALDYTFYRWFKPRLKRFMEVNIGYPGNEDFPTFESWQAELSKRVDQLEAITTIYDVDFKDWSYIPKDILTELKKKKVKETVINSVAYDKCEEDFNKWFAEHINWLWW